MRLGNIEIETKLSIDEIEEKLTAFAWDERIISSNTHTISEAIRKRGYILSHFLFIEEYSNEYLLGAIETLEGIFSSMPWDEKNLKFDFVGTFRLFRELVGNREVLRCQQNYTT